MCTFYAGSFCGWQWVWMQKKTVKLNSILRTFYSLTSIFGYYKNAWCITNPIQNLHWKLQKTFEACNKKILFPWPTASKVLIYTIQNKTRTLLTWLDKSPIIWRRLKHNLNFHRKKYNWVSDVKQVSRMQ